MCPPGGIMYESVPAPSFSPVFVVRARKIRPDTLMTFRSATPGVVKSSDASDAPTLAALWQEPQDSWTIGCTSDHVGNSTKALDSCDDPHSASAESCGGLAWLAPTSSAWISAPLCWRNVGQSWTGLRVYTSDPTPGLNRTTLGSIASWHCEQSGA